mmetsp:Transcript_23632/g.30627  ORF Transcript_23632/g.30627 Transcript_23632/m.30627 type:complete len:105 (-) Transcript_23632:731-1045(-)
MKICLNRKQKEIKTSPEQRAQCLQKQQPQGLLCDHEFRKTQFGNDNFWTPCWSYIKNQPQPPSILLQNEKSTSTQILSLPPTLFRNLLEEFDDEDLPEQKAEGD